MIAITPRSLPILTAMVLSAGLAACAGEPPGDADAAGDLSLTRQTDEARSGESVERAGAEAREADEEHAEEGEEGEESGDMIARTATWDRLQDGARLLLSFNAASNTFVGRVENISNDPLCDVRVEVHLDTGVELGPTEPTDVPYTRSISVSLPAGGQEFSTWTAHPEMSRCDNQ